MSVSAGRRFITGCQSDTSFDGEFITSVPKWLIISLGLDYKPNQTTSSHSQNGYIARDTLETR
jgi:hypothetical protein